jgi:O-antigen/teichoic acid export membrane protein
MTGEAVQRTSDSANPGGIKRQVASGLVWVALAQVMNRGLAYLTTLILAKLLAPSMFGLMGMAMLAINALALFQDIGFESALIYRRKNVQEASHTAFYTVIISSVAIFLIIVAAAPLIAGFFQEPDLTPLLRVLALTVVISSFGRVPYVLLSREMDFRRRIFPELSAGMIASAAAIVLAFRGYGVWSLVWRELIRDVLATVLVWFVSAYRPAWRYSRNAARDLFNYGKHIMASQGLIFLITNVDNAIVGRYLGSEALGFYQFAYSTANQPATQMTSIISQVMFPAFSKMADADPGQAKILRERYYLTIVRYVTWITTPIAVAMILFAPAFINGLYGDVWAPAIVPLQLLAVYGYLRSIAANMGSVFRAMGKPQWLTSIALWRLLTMIVLLIPVSLRWGINGVSWLSVIVAVVDFCISATLLNRLISAPWQAYARMLAPSWAVALASGLGALWLYARLPFAKAAWNLLLAGVILVVVYFALSWLVDRELRDTARSLFWQARRLLNRPDPVTLPGGSGAQKDT